MAPRCERVANKLRGRRAELLSGAMEKVPAGSWDPYQGAHDKKVAVMQQFCPATGRPDSSIRQREAWNGYLICLWPNSRCTRRDVLSAAQEAGLEALPGWAGNQRGDQWTPAARGLRFSARAHLQPSLTRGDEQEVALARWKRHNRNRLQGRSDAKALQPRALPARVMSTVGVADTVPPDSVTCVHSCSANSVAWT